MGRSRGKSVIGRDKWVTCLVFVLLMGIVHWTASNSTYLATSFKGLSQQAFQVYSDPHKRQKSIPSWKNQNQGNPDASSPVQDHEAISPRVAICLVGGARAFELTGLTIKKYLLDVHKADVFLHVPADENTHKLTILQNASNLAVARIFVPQHIPENQLQREVLSASHSPNGIQGLLQYFNLVEGCLDMISWYEIKHEFKYDWIIRTRVDGYWNGPLAPISKFNPQYYHVPYGSSFGGLNDRLGVGTRNTSWAALSRLSLLPKLHENGYRYLNSETAFRSQLIASNITVEHVEVPFCILSSRKYAWPLMKWGVPVVSIRSKGNLNGAKCRPCHPVASGALAQKLLDQVDHGWGWLGPGKAGDIQLCNSTLDEEPGWEDVYDKASGLESAHCRKQITGRRYADCYRDVKKFEKSWEFWDAPTAESLCASNKV